MLALQTAVSFCACLLLGGVRGAKRCPLPPTPLPSVLLAAARVYLAHVP